MVAMQRSNPPVSSASSAALDRALALLACLVCGGDLAAGRVPGRA
jgi:hypothetical protein